MLGIDKNIWYFFRSDLISTNVMFSNLVLSGLELLDGHLDAENLSLKDVREVSGADGLENFELRRVDLDRVEIGRNIFGSRNFSENMIQVEVMTHRIVSHSKL